METELYPWDECRICSHHRSAHNIKGRCTLCAKGACGVWGFTSPETLAQLCETYWDEVYKPQLTHFKCDEVFGALHKMEQDLEAKEIDDHFIAEDHHSAYIEGFTRAMEIIGALPRYDVRGPIA